MFVINFRAAPKIQFNIEAYCSGSLHCMHRLHYKYLLMKNIFIILASSIFFACGRPVYENPHVLIKTGYGDIELELFPGKAPATVKAFLAGIDSGIYTESSFYRVLKAEELPTDHNTGIIQGGIWKRAPQKSETIKGIRHESTKLTGLSHTDGTISMARQDTGTAKTEFFICIGDQSSLDEGRRGTPYGQGYAAFGRVFSGMDVVRKIQSQKNNGDAFIKDIAIQEISRF